MLIYNNYRKGIESQIKESTTNALKESGEVIVDEAKQLVPVDSGALRDSIDFEVNELELTIGASEKYAGFVELGTSKQTSQPYLRPSIMGNIDKLSDIISDSIGDL